MFLLMERFGGGNLFYLDYSNREYTEGNNSSSYSWTNNTGYPCFCTISCQCYKNHVYVSVDGIRVAYSNYLTNSERSVYSVSIIVNSGSTFELTGANTNTFGGINFYAIPIKRIE